MIYQITESFREPIFHDTQVVWFYLKKTLEVSDIAF